jgi:glutaredoxin
VPPILVLGRDTCEDTTAAREHLAARGIPFSYRNHELDPGADALIRAHNDGRLVTPTILIGDPVRPSRVLVEPSRGELDAALELESA